MLERDEVLTREAQLDGYFEPGSKPRGHWGVGLEYERFGLLEDSGEPVPYLGPRSVESVRSALVRTRGWEPEEEDGRLLGARRGGTRITLEPSCQMEMSGAVHRDLESMRLELAGYLSDVDSVSEALGLRWIGVGMQPLASLESLPWIPKKRYALMRAYLPTRGTRGLVMMKQTACIQANLDYSDGPDAMEKMRVAMGLSPIVTALFANSPLTEGRPSGYLTSRAWAWRDTDADRCGLLPFVFDEGAGFGDYLEWALDVPLLFVAVRGAYRPGGGVTFRQFIHRGLDGVHPTITDFETHLTTLFPEVRLKRYIELRGADSADPASAIALAALWKGLLYDAEARRSAWSLVADWSVPERNDLLDTVCRLGPGAPLPRAMPGGPSRAGDLFAALLDLARRGLSAQGCASERPWLESLAGRDRTCPAQRLLRDWDGPLGRDRLKLITALSRNTLPGVPGAGAVPPGE